MTTSTPVRSNDRRRGQVLVLMVPILLAFFAFAALVIDLGIVRVTQARMTSATDSAALEALRWRDQPPASAAAGANLDQSRRAAAAALVGTIFSADDPTQPFDAGPQFVVEHATGSLANDADAFATIQPLQNADGSYAGGYRPTVQLNMNDAGTEAVNGIEGDLVAGTYDAADPTVSHADGQLVNGQFVPYERADFAADAPGTDVPGMAMVARLRRTGETAEPGITSIGPPLPLLFGRGAAIEGAAASASSGHSVRRDGISVRAAAIANGIPVVWAGLPMPAYAVQGVVPVAILQSVWVNNLPPASAPNRQPTQVSVTVVGGVLSIVGVGTAGYALETPTAGVAIGSTITTAAQSPTGVLTGYFPIIATPPATQADPNPAARVVGFGWATLDLTAGTLSKLSMVGGAVAPWNTSADLRDAWATLAALDADTQAFVRSANAGLADPVRAAVGVRATDLPPDSAAE